MFAALALVRYLYRKRFMVTRPFVLTGRMEEMLKEDPDNSFITMDVAMMLRRYTNPTYR